MAPTNYKSMVAPSGSFKLHFHFDGQRGEASWAFRTLFQILLRLFKEQDFTWSSSLASGTAASSRPFASWFWAWCPHLCTAVAVPWSLYSTNITDKPGTYNITGLLGLYKPKYRRKQTDRNYLKCSNLELPERAKLTED